MLQQGICQLSSQLYSYGPLELFLASFLTDPFEQVFFLNTGMKYMKCFLFGDTAWFFHRVFCVMELISLRRKVVFYHSP